jgi:hypothetical protein
VENVGQKRNALLPSSRQDICNNSSGGYMRGSKPVMQKSPVSYGAHSVPHFSWPIVAQATALAAAFLFVTAMACGAI